MICRFCGVSIEADDLLHALRCDGQQGHVEAFAAAVDTETTEAAEPTEDPLLLARSGDPETSHAAMAAYDRDRMRSAMDVVVALYQERGPMADYELRQAFEARWTEPCCDHLYRQARSAARDHGLITDTGDRRVNPETNRRQVVWAWTETAPPIIRRCETCGHVLGREEA